MVDDERLARLVSIDGPRHRLVIGSQTGGAESALNRHVRELAATATRFRFAAGEIRGQANLLDSMRGKMIAEAAGKLTEQLKSTSAVVLQEAHRIRTHRATVSPVRDYGATPLHEYLQDDRLVERFKAMTPKDQVVLLHRCEHEPGSHTRWAAALLRQPTELTGLTQAQHDGIRMAMLKHKDPKLADMLDNEETQLQQAQRALQLAQQALAEDSQGALTELRVTAPHVAQASSLEPGAIPDVPAKVAPPQPEGTVMINGVALPLHVYQDLTSGGTKRAVVESKGTS